MLDPSQNSHRPVSPSALIGAIDQGTSSSRFLIFSADTGEIVTYHQVEVDMLYPHEGWVEQDPLQLLNSVIVCIEKACDNLDALNVSLQQISAIGVTNQRETLVTWHKVTGQPLHNAIVWLDARTTGTVNELIAKTERRDKLQFQAITGLPITTYFSAVKLRWLLDNVPAVSEAYKSGQLMCGTVDTWLLWNLTNKTVYATDVTNASRTLLLNIHTLQWSDELCQFFGISPDILPEIRSSAEIYGKLASGPLKGTPLSGILGDQQAALVGQGCFEQTHAKNTYGTGCFMLYNTGKQAVLSNHGLLTTVAYKFGPYAPTYYALEGSVAIAGAAIKWLKDNLGILEKTTDAEHLASQVNNTHGCYFVPAFSGLFCPYWKPDSRGVIVGLTQFTTKEHIVRATLEAVCFQTRQLIDAMVADSEIPLTELQVDGGMTSNHLLLQLQADLTGLPIKCPTMPECTALGAAIAASIGVGLHDAKKTMLCRTEDLYVPSISAPERDARFKRWKMAVERSFGWEEHKSSDGKINDADSKDSTVNMNWHQLSLCLFLMSTFGILAFSSFDSASSS